MASSDEDEPPPVIAVSAADAALGLAEEQEGIRLLAAKEPDAALERLRRATAALGRSDSSAAWLAMGNCYLAQHARALANVRLGPESVAKLAAEAREAKAAETAAAAAAAAADEAAAAAAAEGGALAEEEQGGAPPSGRGTPATARAATPGLPHETAEERMAQEAHVCFAQAGTLAAGALAALPHGGHEHAAARHAHAAAHHAAQWGEARAREALGDAGGALAACSALIEHSPTYDPVKVIFRAGVLLKHTGLELLAGSGGDGPDKRAVGALQQAITYFEYVLADLAQLPQEAWAPETAACWRESDLMVQMAALYRAVPGRVAGKNAHTASSILKELFDQAKAAALGAGGGSPGQQQQQQQQQQRQHVTLQQRLRWHKAGWQDWIREPATWRSFAQTYHGLGEASLEVDALREALRLFRIDWEGGTELPSDAAWDWASWSYVPHAGYWLAMAQALWCQGGVAARREALAALEHGLRLAPYDFMLRQLLEAWAPRKWGPPLQRQAGAALLVQRLQRGCWARRRAALRLRELVHECEKRRRADAIDAPARAVLRVYARRKWTALFAAEDACASRICAFGRGNLARATCATERVRQRRRQIRALAMELQRNWFDRRARAQLSLLDPEKYGRMFAAERRACGVLSRAWSRHGAAAAAEKRAASVLAEHLVAESGAAAVIQRAWRRLKERARRRAERARLAELHHAAALLQARQRGNHARQADHARREAQLSRARERRALVAAATRVQTRWRARRDRVEFLHERHAIMRVQAVLRGRVGRRLVAARRLRYCVRLQSFFRMAHARHRLLGMLTSAAEADAEEEAAAATAAAAAGGDGGDGDGGDGGGGGGGAFRSAVHELAERVMREQMRRDAAEATLAAEAAASTWEHVPRDNPASSRTVVMSEADLDDGLAPQQVRRLMGGGALLAVGVDELDAGRAEALARNLAVNRTVRTLVLANCRAGQRGLRAIGEALATNSTLEHLAIGANGIGPDDGDDVDDDGNGGGGGGGCGAAEALSSVLRVKNMRLQTLLIEDNPLGGASCLAIARLAGDYFVARYSALTTLSLSRCRAGDAAGAAFAVALRTNKTIATLRLAGNGLRDGAARELAGALAENATLRELDLSDNCIGTPGAAAFAEALFVNRALAALRLANNFVDERAWPRLRDALGRNGTLQRLTLSGNMLPPHTFKEAAAFLARRRDDAVAGGQQLPPLPPLAGLASPANSSRLIRKLLEQPEHGGGGGGGGGGGSATGVFQPLVAWSKSPARAIDEAKARAGGVYGARGGNGSNRGPLPQKNLFSQTR
jgi:hypothetical protein